MPFVSSKKSLKHETFFHVDYEYYNNNLHITIYDVVICNNTYFQNLGTV